MNFTKLKMLILAGIASIFAMAFTPSSLASDEETRLERVVVTASKVPEWASRRAATTIVIDDEEIRQQSARDIAELLQFHAGIDLGRNGGPGQTTSLFVRGSESNHVLVMVDGVRINPGTIGVSAIQNMDPDLVERVEVVKGPRSTLYGSDAIGAVVNIITRKTYQPNDVRFSVGAGSFDSLDVGLQAGLGDDTLGGNIALTWQDTEGFATREGATEDHGHDNVSVTMAAWQEINNHRFVLDYWRAQGNTEYAGFSLQALDQDYTNQTIKGTLVSTINSLWQSNLSVSHVIDDIKQQQANFLGSKDFLTTSRLAFDWQNTFSVQNDNRFIAGLYTYDENAEALSFGLPVDEDTRVFAAYSEYAMTGEQYDTSIAARYTDHDDFGSAVTWHLDGTYQITPTLQFIAAVGTGFRAPDATDRFGFGGNAQLEPEEATTAEVGLRYRWADQHLVGVRGFNQDIDNLINYVVTNFDTFAGMNENIDETETKGIELSYVYEGSAFSLRSEAIFQQPEDKSTGLTLLRRAERSLTTNASYRFGFNTLGLNILASGERPDIDATTFGRITSPGYVLADINFSRPIANNWFMRAKVGNILDTKYQTADGFNTAERNYYVEFSYRLGAR